MSISKNLDYKQYVFGLPRTLHSLIPIFTSKHTFFTSNNGIFNTNLHTHFFYTSFIKETPKNRYTRKQPTHFSMKP